MFVYKPQTAYKLHTIYNLHTNLQNTKMEGRVNNKLEKTAIFMAIDIIMVFILTWFWIAFAEDKISDYSHIAQSAMYTVFITMCFGVYYFVFDLSWRHIKKDRL